MFRHTGMTARIQRESRGWQSSWTQRLTLQFFSWTIFRAYAYEKCGFGKHSVYTHFLQAEIARFARGPKLLGPRAEDALAEPYFVQKILVTWLQQITKFSVTIVNLETIIDMQSFVQDLATQWIQSYPCKTKTSQEPHRSLQKFLEPNRKPKVIYTDNSFEFGKVCEDLSWNHCTSTPHRSGTNGIAERAVRRVKEGACRFYGMVYYLRNIKDLLSLGKLHTKDVLENHLKDQSFRLVDWLSFTLSLRKTSQESINLERKSYLDCSSDTLCTRGEFGRVTYLSQTLRSWKRWTYLKSTQKDSMRKRWYFPKKKEKFSSRRWTNQTSWRRSGPENTHLDTGTPNSRRKSQRFSWRIRRVSTSTTSRLTSGCRWSDK